MKIITINVNKGGAGKTTLAYNLAEFLKQDHRVLLMDFDDSANLTHRYGHFTNLNQTVINLFENGDVKPIALKNNLDLIAGHSTVEQLKERLNTRRQREIIFGKWLAQNEQELTDKYDYLIIDTENDEGILTQNALIVSDLVIGVAEASKDSFVALLDLKQFVSELNQDFDVQAKLTFVANKINLSENASKELLEELHHYQEYRGYLPRRTKLADDAPIIECHDQGLINQLTRVFEEVLS
ncbi:ParA family protein [Fructobacillus evanidus]|uniref:ParA-like ATPase involved in chromosome/plasmid partitioning or cellulose biosynthesis protein BcsQ (ParA) n=1 Tax=Fructobacillus evanidus TaxID=3064281 RepID=A0ABN9YXC0_9LACO|nr:ParA-like ATPase involved in chromosome/plasmid partitioning or cellulose biosynthesis protein BcsQ (ParA) [Fructobacillus sp. LMG 32999]CAK1229194.1 ParA-like ATPase involved in chromosome/plasmid partitioning or cellulose biosynthesis protein BcsQ (ParA) [Fructobacillus sp. LMG 32999]CAK1231426.1 ParA-like ATPase involved in chromosome/plasmid partitioning or cellulose biosynthesis protein BcsQ (ParA) [Fructobacillus sp. LMG 32999]CAK1231536.1 ParA-like ATPase involved in chromosome/plasmid